MVRPFPMVILQLTPCLMKFLHLAAHDPSLQLFAGGGGGAGRQAGRSNREPVLPHTASPLFVFRESRLM
jgi:hypothetical protein